MNRITLSIAGAVAACAAAVPAVLGLSGNPSFSQRIPVPVPSKAHVVQFNDSGQAVADITRSSSSPAEDRSSSGREAELGDDHGRRSSEPGDDHGRDGVSMSSSESREPGDDRGTSASRSREPGDDRGDRGSTTATRTPSSSAPVSSTSSEPGDDRGRHGGSDDSGHSGGHGSDDS